MSRSPSLAAAGSRLVPRVLAYVRQRGGDGEALVRRFSFARDIAGQTEVPIAPADFEAFVEAAAAMLGDPCLAVHLAAELEWPTYSIPELAARASPTLGAALERVARYGSLFYAHLVLAWEEKGDELVFSHRTRGAPGAPLRYSNEYAVASALAHARRLVEEPLTPRRVWFAHATLEETGGLERFFGTSEIAFGRADSGLALPLAVAALPTRTRDPRLLATAEAMAERALHDAPRAADFTGAVAKKLREVLGKKPAQVSEVARQMRLSARTLQRRLEAEGTGWKELLESVRRDLARGWVSEGALPLGEIAYRLGYSDVAAFSRAFKRWTGRSPGAYRTPR